jgi:predicted phage-related endonuclease
MKEDNVIDKYYAQVQHYMMVADMKQAWLSVIFGNLKYKAYHIQQDKEFQTRLLKAEKLFWEHMLSDNEPADYVDFDIIQGE